MTVYDAAFIAARRSTWRVPAAVIAACLVALLPILFCTLPPVMDLPNHLTRIWLLGGGIRTPPLSMIYEARWLQASTNVAVDFFGAVLVQTVGLAATAKILLAMMLIGPPLGAAFLNRAIFGRFHVWQLAGVTLIWCTTAVEGFLSFQIGLAAALFCAAAVLPLLHALTASRAILILFVAAALLLIHPFAVVLFGAVICGITLGDRLLPLRALIVTRSARILALAGICVLPLVLLFLLAPDPPGAHNLGTHLLHWEPIAKTFSPKNLALLYFSPFLSYRVVLDLGFIAALGGVVLWALWSGRLHIHAGLFAIAIPLIVIAPFLPTNIGDGGALPARFPIMGALMLLAGTRVAFEERRGRIALATVLILIALARVGTIAWVWHMRGDDAQQLELATSKIPSGASVMVLQERWRDTSTVPLGRLIAACPFNVCAAERHYGSFAVVWRHAFIPTLFTVPGQQPLGVREPWTSKAVHSSGIPFVDEIDTAHAKLHDPYLSGWQNRFDYVLVLDADLARTTPPDVALISDTGFARLYRVVHARSFTALVH